MVTSKEREVELWSGKKLIGTVLIDYTLLIGRTVMFCFAPSPLRQVYGRSYETLSLPVMCRYLPTDGPDYIIRRCLDVRRKSKRQIEMLKKHYGPRK